MIGKVKKFGHEDLDLIAFDFADGFADDMSVACRDPPNWLIGPDLPDEETEVYIKPLVR